ncbi:hypothetical protein BC829DRAFT_449362 [Chytridium lagenaria]|nr:hypothetical protein BC829DRAFT_449362 [Chytridium lagenaria]
MRDAPNIIPSSVESQVQSSRNGPPSVLALKQQLQDKAMTTPPPLPQLDRKPKRGNVSTNQQNNEISPSPAITGITHLLLSLKPSLTHHYLRVYWSQSDGAPTTTKEEANDSLAAGTDAASTPVVPSSRRKTLTSPNATQHRNVSEPQDGESAKRPARSGSTEFERQGTAASSSGSVDKLGSANDICEDARSSIGASSIISTATTRTRAQGGRKSFNLWRHGSLASQHSGSTPGIVESTTLSAPLGRAGSVGTSLITAFKEIGAHVQTVAATQRHGHERIAREDNGNAASNGSLATMLGSITGTFHRELKEKDQPTSVSSSTVVSLSGAVVALQEDLGQLTFDHEKLQRALAD